MAKDEMKEKSKTKRMTCCGCARNRNSDIFCEDPMLSDQQQYRYMTVDDMKSMGDDSMRVNVTDDERDNRHSGTTVTEMITKENYHRTSAVNLKPDNVDINRHPVHVGFLVSFLVDARGGAMRGCRHSGVRVIVPPRKAAMPMRVTCRYLKRDKLTNPPPLMEGEALASRILELGPVGAKFLGPVIIEVPHFASLRGKEREIVILRSDNGETWREHTLEASEEAVQDVLNESFEGEELSQLEDLQTSRIVRVLTLDFPHYFAVVSRIRQEVHAVGPEGGTVSSSAVPQVQAVFPPAALTKKIRVGLQAHPIPAELVAKLLGNRVAVSPIVTVEPRRRKFHKPITLTIPVPQAANKGMINQYSGDAPTLRLLCSITGGQSRAVWEDVTGSTPLTFVKDCVSFTTTVSARFWLMDCRNITEATRMATELYTHATHVPFMAKFVVFAKRVDPLEARLRVFCMTDDKEDKTLEHQEHFEEVAKSRDVEVLEGKTQYMEFAGNLVPVMKSGEQLQLPFRAFKENRIPFTARVKDPDAADMVGRIMFMSEPKVQKGEPPQTPICTLNILLPEKISPEAAHSELDLLELSKNYSFLRDGGISRPDTIHRATIRLTDIANLLDRDWEKLAEELNISPNEVDTIKNEHPGKPALQAAAMFKLWQGNGNKATGNTLEKALNKIGREDIVKKCIFNVELVTDDVEKAVAKVRLDQHGFDSLKEELGPSRDSSLRRDGTLDPKLDPDYEEPDHMRDSESVEDLIGMGSVARKSTKPHVTITNGTVFNGTSTPIKDKYASEEKELVDDMAAFIAHEVCTKDTMTKKSRDIPDDDNKKRQSVYEDANRIVTGVIQDAEKEKEKLAKEGWSGAYHDNARSSNEAEGAVGQRLARIDNMIITDEPDFGQFVPRQIDDIETLIVKQCRKIPDEPKGTIVSTKTIVSTQDDPKSGQSVITKTSTVREYDRPVTFESVSESVPSREMHYFGANDPVIGLEQSNPVDSKLVISMSPPTTDLTERVINKTLITKGPIIEKKIVTVIDSRSDEPPQSIALVGDNVKLHGQTVSFDTNVTTDRAKEDVVKSIAKVYPDCVTMLAESSMSLESEKEKLSKEDKEIAEKTPKDVVVTQNEAKQKSKEIKGILKSDVKKTTEKDKPAGDDKQSAYEVVYNAQQSADDTKEKIDAESKKQKEKSGGIFSGIFKGPKLKKSKSKDSKDTSFDSGDEEPKIATTKFLEDTRKTADSGHQPLQPSSKIHISVSPPTIQVSGPEYSVRNATADFLEDSRRSAAFFHPQLNETDKASVITADTKAKPSEEKTVTSKNTDDDEESTSKAGFFSSFFRSSKPKVEESIDGATDDAKKAAEVAEEKIKKSAEYAKKNAEDIADPINVSETKMIVGAKGDLKNIEGDVAEKTIYNENIVKNGAKHHAEDVKKPKDTFFKELKEDSDKAIKDGDTMIDERILSNADDVQLAGDKVMHAADKSVKSFVTTAGDAKHTSEDLITTTKTDLKNIDDSLSARDKQVKDKPEIAKDGSRDSEDETKEKSGGFFGMFRSPRGKKRSHSKDKDSSKHESLDSGDEELRIATGTFLDDARKVSEKIYEPTVDEVEPKKYFDVKIDRFVASNETLFDTPKDKVDSTSYDVAMAKGKAENQGKHGVETLVTKVYSASTKIIDKPEDPKADKDNGTSLKNQPALKNETGSNDDSGDFEDSQTSDDGKQKSFFGLFKSPKLKNRKKSRSRERSTSKERSFESGDEEAQRELRDATNKFLQDTRRTADNLHESVLEESTFVSNKTIPISPEDGKVRECSPVKRGRSPITESEQINSRVTDVGETTTDDKHHEVIDGKEKSGIFGIFKSPISTLKRRSKSREKSPSADVSFDSGDEDLRIATGKFLEDTRNVAVALAEPYKKDIRKDETETKFADELIETGTEKKGEHKTQGKEGGFLFGILKGAKHAVEEVSEDVKEFWDDTNKEAIEEEKRVGHASREVEKFVKNTEDETSCQVLETKDKLKDKTSTGLQKVVDHTRTAEKYAEEKVIGTKDAVLDAAKITGQKISDTAAKAAQTATDASDKLGKDYTKGKDAVVEEIKKDTKVAKTKISAGVETVAETADAAKDKTVKDAKKIKAKTGGFLSGIFKGAKHAADEVSQDVKPFVEEATEEATKKEEKIKQTTEKASKSIKDSKNKIAADVENMKDKLAEEVSISVQKVKDETKAATEQVEDTATFAEDVVSHAAEMTGKKVAETTTSKADKAMTNTAEKLSTEAASAKDAMSKDIKEGTRAVKDKISGETESNVEILDAAKDEVVRDAKKAKAKAGGFLSGIFKSAKHAADDISEDVKEFVDETKQDVASGREKAKEVSEEATGAAKNSKEKIAMDLRDARDKLADGVSAETKKIVDEAKAVKDNVKQSAISAKDATSDLVKVAGVKAIETVDKAAKITTDAAEKLGRDAVHAKDAVGENIKQGTTTAKDKVVAGVETGAETADAFKDKVVKDAKKVKGKASGFLSGIFKGAKNSTDEVTDDVEDFIEVTKKEASREKEEAKRAILAAEEAVNDKATLNIHTARDILTKDASVPVREADGTKPVEYRVKSELNSTKDTVSDAAKEIGQKVSETTAHAAKVVTDEAHKLGEDAEKTKDILSTKVKAGVETTKSEVFDGVETVDDTAQTTKDTAEEEVKKAKSKSGGFLSGIIKGAKQAVGEASGDVKEFWDETKQEAADEEERARQAAEEIAKSVKDAEVNADLNVHKTKESLKDKVIVGVQDVIDHTKETEKHAEEKLMAAKDSIADAAITTGEKVSEMTAKTAKTLSDAAHKVEKDAAQAKAAVSKEIKEDVKGAKDKVAAGADAVSKTADATKERVSKDAKKAKKKAGGFLTGIFKSPKHASDEVSEGVKEFVDDTVEVTDAVKDTLMKETSDAPNKVSDQTKATKAHVKDTVTTAKDALSDATKQTGDKLLESTPKAIGATTQTVKKPADNVMKATDATSDAVEANIETKKAKVVTGAETAVESVDRTKNALKNEENKTKAKSDSFLLGIIKGAEHAVDEISEDVKEFWDETKQEAAEEEERTRRAAEEAANSIKVVEDNAVLKLQTGMDQLKGQTSSGVREVIDKTEAEKEHLTEMAASARGAASVVANATEKNMKTTQKAAEVTKETAEKLGQDVRKTMDDLNVEIKVDAEAAKEKVLAGAEIVDDTTDAAKEKIIKNAKKTKGKSGGFLSGIFKGAKHVTDELCEEAEEFVDKTKQMAAKEEKVKLAVKDTAKSAEQTKDRVSSDVGAAKDKVAKQTSIGAQNVLDGVHVEKQSIKDNASSVSGVLEDTLKKTGKEIDGVSAKLTIATTDAVQKISDDIDTAEDKTRKKIKTDVELVKDKVATKSKAFVDTTNSTKDAVAKEVKEVKTRGSGFLSGLLEGAKHAVDEVSDDVKEFWDETKEEAAEEEQRLRQADENAAKLVQDAKLKATSELHAAKDELGVQVSAGVKEVIDHTTVAKKNIEQKLISAEDAVLGATTATAEKVSDAAAKARTATTDGFKKLGKDVSEAKDATGKAITESMKEVKDKVTTGAEAVAETADAAKDKIARDGKKAKAKSGGFLSGILKGAKHASDEVEEDTKKLIEETKQHAANEQEKVKHVAHETAKSVKDSKDKVVADLQNSKDKLREGISDGAQKVVDLTKVTKSYVNENAASAKDIVVDAKKATGEKIVDAADKVARTTNDATDKLTEEIGKAKDVVRHEIKDHTKVAKDKIVAATESVAGTVDDAKDKVVKDAKKAKVKAGGFLSGIFKGAKSTADDVSTDVKDFIEETKKEASREKEQAEKAAEEAATALKDSTAEATSEVHAAAHKLIADISDEVNEVIVQTKDDKKRVERTLTSAKESLSDAIQITEKKKHGEPVTEAVDATKENVVEDAKKVKGKPGNFLSGIFKGAKHAFDEVIDDAKDFVDEVKQEATEEEENAKRMAAKATKSTNDSKNKVSAYHGETKEKLIEGGSDGSQKVVDQTKAAKQKIKETVTSTKDEVLDVVKLTGEKVSDAAEEAAKTTTDTAEKLDDDVDKVNNVMSTKIKKDTKAVKEIVTGKADDAVKGKNDLEHEAKKAKTKTGGILSGIIKGAKHAVEEVSEDVKEFWDETEEEAAHEEERVRRAAEETAKKVKSTEDDAVSKIHAAKDGLNYKAKSGAQAVIGYTKGVEKQVEDKLIATNDALSNAAKLTGEMILDTTGKAVKASKDTAEKLKTDATITKEAISKEIKEDTEATKAKISGGAEAVSQSADAAKDEIVNNVKKAKGKAGGFLSGIFKGSKHSADEVSEDMKQFTDDTKQEAILNVRAATDKIVGETTLAEQRVIDGAKSAEEMITEKAASAKTILSDSVKKTGKEISDVSSKAAATTTQVGQTLSEDMHKNKSSESDKINNVIETTKDKSAVGTEPVIDTATAAKKSAEKEVKTVGFFSGIVKGAKHAVEGVSEEVKEFWETKQEPAEEEKQTYRREFVDEAKHKVSKEDDRLQYAINEVSKSAEQTKDEVVSRTHAPEDELKKQAFGIVQKTAEYTVAAEEEAKRKLAAAKDSVIDAAKTTKTEVLNATKTASSETADTMSKLRKNDIKAKDDIKEEIKVDAKKVQRKVSEGAEAIAEKVNTAKEQAEKESDAAKTKGGGFLSSIIKGAKHAVDEVTEDAKEFWDETKQEATLEEEQAKQAAEKIIRESHDESGEKKSFRETDIKDTVSAKVSPVREVSSDFSGRPASTVAGSGKVQMSENFSTLCPESDAKMATLMFLEDSTQAASLRNDQPLGNEFSESSASEASSPRDSLERDGSPQKSKSRKSKKSKGGVISSIVKGAKGATHKIAKEIDHATDNIKGSTVKFWEDTKQESKETFGSSGSYEVSSPLRDTEVVREVDVSDTKSDVRLESFGPLDRVGVSEVVQSGMDGKSKSVSRIPQKMSPTKEIKEIKHVTSEKSDRLIAGVSSKLEHLEPRAHQTVTTVITKSVRTASTPPPSPAEFSDSSIKDVTEEAVKRAQNLTDQALAIEKPESDFMQHSEPSYMETTTTEVDPESHERITRTTRVTTTMYTTAPMTGSATGGSDELRGSMPNMIDQFLNEERRQQ